MPDPQLQQVRVGLPCGFRLTAQIDTVVADRRVLEAAGGDLVRWPRR